MRHFHRRIRDLFKTICSEAKLSCHAIDLLNDYMVVFLKQVARLAHEARCHEDKKTLMVRHVLYAAHHFHQDDIDAIVEECILEFDAKQGMMKHTRREEKAQLIFPVALCERYLRHGSDALMDTHAAIAVTAMVELFCKSLLPTNTSPMILTFLESSRRSTLRVSNLMDHWSTLPQVQQVLYQLRLTHPSRQGYNRDLHGAITKPRRGVPLPSHLTGEELIIEYADEEEGEQPADPSLPTETVPTENPSSPSSEGVPPMDETVTKPEVEHRRRKPGKLAQLSIRKYQRNQHRILRKVTFQRWVRSLIEEKAGRDIRFQSRSLRDLQCWLEHCMVGYLQRAQALMVYTQHRTTQPKDLLWVYQQDHPTETLEDMSSLSPAILMLGYKRLCYRAGLERHAKDLTITLASLLTRELLRVVNSLVYALNAVHTNTVSHQLLVWVIDQQ